MTEETKQQLMAAGVLVPEALERFMGNAGMLERFLKKFLEDKNGAMLSEAMQAGDYAQAFMAAHTLKGVCGNLSMQSLYEKASVVVEALRAQQTEAAQAEIQDFLSAYESMQDSIRRALL